MEYFYIVVILWNQENEVSLWQWSEDSEPMEVADGQTGVSEPQLLASFNHAFGENTICHSSYP